MQDRWLFRGKRKDNGEWIEGSLCLRDSYDQSLLRPGERYMCIISLSEKDSGTWYKVDPDTVGQCSGLRDMHDKLMFEGDIVKTKYYGKDDGEGHNFSTYDIFAIVFHISRFCIENATRRFIVGLPHEHYEIIGNIHDNPELLKEG